MEWDRESLNLTYTSDHTWGRAADLKVVLADSCTIEHSVEACYFIDLHRGHLEDLRGFVHSRQGQEVVVLLLGNEKHGNNS